MVLRQALSLWLLDLLGLCAFLSLESPSELLSGHPGSSSPARSSQMLAGISCFLPGPYCSGWIWAVLQETKFPTLTPSTCPDVPPLTSSLSLAKVMELTSPSERRNRSIDSTHSTHFLPATSSISVGVEGRHLPIWRVLQNPRRLSLSYHL